jgi:tRNA(Ile2) C34 agmatinyltransferase TiaS
MEGETIREALQRWQQAHPQATFDEIEDVVYQQVVQLHGTLVDELLASAARPEREVEQRPICPSCGERMRPSGHRRRREVVTRLGQRAPLERTYYVCPACGGGHFPPR